MTDGLHARLQALCAMLTAAIQQAREAWQYVVISWPAWQASLAEDIEFLLEYTVGVFPAWIASLKAVLQKAYIHITSTPQVHQVAMMASNAAKDLSTSLQQLRRAIIETRQLTQRRWVPGEECYAKNLFAIMYHWQPAPIWQFGHLRTYCRTAASLVAYFVQLCPQVGRYPSNLSATQVSIRSRYRQQQQQR